MGIATITALRLYQADLMQEVFMTQDESVAHTDNSNKDKGKSPKKSNLSSKNSKVQQQPQNEEILTTRKLNEKLTEQIDLDRPEVGEGQDWSPDIAPPIVPGKISKFAINK